MNEFIAFFGPFFFLCIFLIFLFSRSVFLFNRSILLFWHWSLRFSMRFSSSIFGMSHLIDLQASRTDARPMSMH
jgi:hypothetical protein